VPAVLPRAAIQGSAVVKRAARRATAVLDAAFDGLIDFDKALSDGKTPASLVSTYDSGDGLHPNVAGHQKLADTVDLALFSN